MNTFILFKVSASSESMYDDAYTLQHVTSEDVHNFNYVAGMVPFLFNLIQDVRARWRLTAKKKTPQKIWKGCLLKNCFFFPFQLQMEPELNAKKTHGIITVRVLQRKKWPLNII